VGEIAKLDSPPLLPRIFNPLQQQGQSGAVAVAYAFEVDRDLFTRSKIAAQQGPQAGDSIKIQRPGKSQAPVTGQLELCAVTLLQHVSSDS